MNNSFDTDAPRSEDDLRSEDRRRLFRASGVGAAGLALAPAAVAQTLVPQSVVDTGTVQNGRVVFPEWRGPADTPSGPTPAPLSPEQRIGFAVVGLGKLALEEILPAFGQSTKGRCVALVSGTPAKLRAVAAQYGIEPGSCYSYDAFDQIRSNAKVQVVYIALPNAMQPSVLRARSSYRQARADRKAHGHQRGRRPGHGRCLQRRPGKVDGGLPASCTRPTTDAQCRWRATAARAACSQSMPSTLKRSHRTVHCNATSAPWRAADPCSTSAPTASIRRASSPARSQSKSARAPGRPQAIRARGG